MALMKLEGEIVIAADLNIGTFAGSTITVPQGNYFLSSTGDGGATLSLTAKLKALLDAGPGGTWTVTVDDDADTSLGKVTIARNSNYTATWNSTDFRNALGFTGDLSTASTSSFTGANQAKYLFLPNCGRSGVMGPEASDGAIESDYTISISTDGGLYALAYSKRYLDSLEWRTLKGSKVWNCLDVTTNEALEQFWNDVIFYGLRVRFHADRSVDATYRTWVIENAGSFNPQPVRPDWTDSTESLWAIRYQVRKSS